MNHKWKDGRNRDRCLKCGIVRYKKRVADTYTLSSGDLFTEYDSVFFYLTTEGEFRRRPDCVPNEILMRNLKK